MKRALPTLLLLACGAPEPATFIALPRDFADYASWRTHTIEADEEAHGVGERHVFINEARPASGQPFRNGTIIVKEVRPSADPSTWDIHAMAKRGGDFNEKGARGWEWFDLGLADDGTTPVIKWRGTTGSRYKIPGQEEMTAECNSCHGASASTDFVLDPTL